MTTARTKCCGNCIFYKVLGVPQFGKEELGICVYKVPYFYKSNPPRTIFLKKEAGENCEVFSLPEGNPSW